MAPTYAENSRTGEAPFAAERRQLDTTVQQLPQHIREQVREYYKGFGLFVCVIALCTCTRHYFIENYRFICGYRVILY